MKYIIDLNQHAPETVDEQEHDLDLIGAGGDGGELLTCTTADASRR